VKLIAFNYHVKWI